MSAPADSVASDDEDEGRDEEDEEEESEDGGEDEENEENEDEDEDEEQESASISASAIYKQIWYKKRVATITMMWFGMCAPTYNLVQCESQ